MKDFPTRLLQDNLRIEQIRLAREKNPEMVTMRKAHISALARELLRRWREESARLAG